MKKILQFLFISLLFPGISLAQTTRFKGLTPLPVKSSGANKPTFLQKSFTGDEIISPGVEGVQQRNHGNINSTSVPIPIGNTTYDLQTNGSGCNRIYSHYGKIGATWTYSTQFGTFSDRGTAYNYYDGSSWGAFPVSTIDTLAWSNIDIGSANTEFVVGHNKQSSTDDLILMSRFPAGTGAWTRSVLPPHPGGNQCLWSRMRVGGANGQTIHVIALTRPVANGGTLCNNVDGALTYSRSQDGGLTWDIVHAALPMIDGAHYASMKADSYTIDVKGNTVAIVQGSMHNDWVLWKSTDNGSNWTRTVILPFPIPAYDPQTMTTDVNGDAVADTIDFIDGALAVIVDNNNKVHCWSGRMMVYQDSAGTTMFAYFQNTDGLLYWNENFQGSPPIIIAVAEDIDGSGSIEIEDGNTGYGASLTSMPTAGIDGTSNIVVAYSGIVENTSNGMATPYNYSYRNIYCIISPDNGNSWALPVRLDPSDFDESVYPSMARNVGPLMHMICQRDIEPGISVINMGPYGTNEIMYFEEDPQILFSGITIIPYNFYKLEGSIYYDQNQNGINDAGDYGLTGFPLQLNPDNITYYSNSAGNYLMTTDSGMKTITPFLSGNWNITTDSSSYTVLTDTSVISNLDFGLYPVNLVYDVNTTLASGIPRCNNYINYWITIHNTGTVTTSGTVRFVKDNQLVYSSATPPYTSASADTFEWNFANLLPFESRQMMITLTSFGLNIGDTLFNCATTYYDNGSTGGVSEECETQFVVCSYDPNDKAVIPDGVGVPHYSLLSDTLIYTIRFQNTGNDTAFSVLIRDTLDAFLNPSTFRLLASSHPVDATIHPGGIVLFNFPNILLPDSNVNLIGSNGFVKYSVEPLAGLPIGTAIYNTGYIFFDYNPAIVTNTTLNTLVDVIGFEEISSDAFDMIIYPNPVTDEANLRFSQTLVQSHYVTISDITGRAVMQMNNVTGDEVKLKPAPLSKGIYLCTLYNASGVRVAVEKLTVR